MRLLLALLLSVAALAGCSGGWVRVDAGLAEALKEVDADRDWRSCLVYISDTTIVVCPDGSVYTS